MNDRIKALLDQANSEFDSAVAEDKETAAQTALGGDKPAQPQGEKSGGFVQWVKNLPANISIGTIDAAVNMWDFVQEKHEQVGEAMDAATLQTPMTPGDRRNFALRDDPEEGELRKAVIGTRNVIAERAGGTADVVTQGAAQFMVPFLGFNKAFRAYKMTAVDAAIAAEAATMAASFDPHGGRLADLVELGKHSEGKLAEALNALAPDGSAVNAYIDYMTSREDESDAEGRFKNVVDGLAGSAVVAGFLKAGAKSLKGARSYIDSPVKLPEIEAPTHLTYEPDIATLGKESIGETTKNTLIDLQGLADVATATPKQQAAIAGLKRNIELALEQGLDVDALVTKAQADADTFLPVGATPDATSRKAIRGVIDEQFSKASKQYTQSLAKRALEEFPDDPMSAMVHLSERADSSLDDAERARIREAADIVSRQIPDAKSVAVVESPEGHTVVVGKQPLVTFTSAEDAAAAVADMRRQFGHAFEKRAAAEHAAASDKNFATLHSFSRVLQSNVDRPVSTHSLLSALEKNIKGDTEQGAFYKELLGRLVRKRLGGLTTVKKSKGRTDDSAGYYALSDNAIEMYPKAFENPQRLIHVFTHEAVHAATVHEMRASPRVSAQMQKLRKSVVQVLANVDASVDPSMPAPVAAMREKVIESQTSQAGAKLAQKLYGLTNAEEFVAEIESNPEFRKLMQKTKLPDGGTAWDKYLETIAGILGITALIKTPDGMKEFSKLMMGDTQEKTPRA